MEDSKQTKKHSHCTRKYLIPHWEVFRKMCNTYWVECVKWWSKQRESLSSMGLPGFGYIEKHFWKVLCRSMQCTELYCGHFCGSQDKETKWKAKAHCCVWSARCSSIYPVNWVQCSAVQCSALKYIHGAIQGRDRYWIVAALGTITIRLYYRAACTNLWSEHSHPLK